MKAYVCLIKTRFNTIFWTAAVLLVTTAAKEIRDIICFLYSYYFLFDDCDIARNTIFKVFQHEHVNALHADNSKFERLIILMINVCLWLTV